MRIVPVLKVGMSSDIHTNVSSLSPPTNSLVLSHTHSRTHARTHARSHARTQTHTPYGKCTYVSVHLLACISGTVATVARSLARALSLAHTYTLIHSLSPSVSLSLSLPLPVTYTPTPTHPHRQLQRSTTCCNSRAQEACYPRS